MEILKPSIAKFISLPTTFVVLLLLIEYLLAFFSDLGNFSIDDQTLFVFGLVISLLFSYVLSSIIWYFGKNHRRLLLVGFTILSVIAVYFLTSFIVSFFGLCLADLGLPCGEDLGPCHVQSQCPLSPIVTFITWLGYGLTLLIFISGSISFVKEGNKKANKGKK